MIPSEDTGLDLKVEDHTCFLYALLILLSAWLLYFMREQGTPVSIHRLGTSLLLQPGMLSTGLIRWPKRWEDTATSLFTAGKLPAGLSYLGLSCSIWRKKFMLLLFSKSYETYHPYRMENVYFSAVMSKVAVHCLVIGLLLLSDLILQRSKLQSIPGLIFSQVCQGSA